MVNGYQLLPRHKTTNSPQNLIFISIILHVINNHLMTGHNNLAFKDDTILLI